MTRARGDTQWVGGVEVMVPEGYRIAKTRDVLKEGYVELYPFKWAARRRCAQLEAEREVASYRWEYESTPQALRERPWGWLMRWAVVPYQNVFERKPVCPNCGGDQIKFDGDEGYALCRDCDWRGRDSETT